MQSEDKEVQVSAVGTKPIARRSSLISPASALNGPASQARQVGKGGASDPLEDLSRINVQEASVGLTFDRISGSLSYADIGEADRQAVRVAIGQAAGDMLNDLELFDVYRGEGIEGGRKSLALSLTLQAADRTLLDAEVDAVVRGVLEALEREYKATLRA